MANGNGRKRVTGAICIDGTPLDQPVRTRGIGTYVQTLIRELRRIDPEGERYSVLRFQAADSVKGGDELRLGVHHVPERLLWLASALLLKGFLRSKRIQLFHSTHPYNLPRSTRFRTVATVYDLIPLLFYDKYLRQKKINAKASYSYYLNRLRRMDHLIAISAQTKRDCIEHLGIADDKITVIQIGVDGDVFRRIVASETLTRIKKKFSLTNEFFLYVGGMDFRKNADRLIDAFAQASATIPHDLVCTGSWSQPAIERTISRAQALGIRDRIHILSYTDTDDLVGLYSLATSLLFPSLYEGFGLPVIEAFKCCTPVLCSNNSSFMEIADGAAVLVDPMSTQEIAAGIVRLAEDRVLRRQLSMLGFERSKHLTPQLMANETVAVYHRILAGVS